LHLSSEPGSQIVQSALEEVQAIGVWRRVVFQGTNYPERNPVTERPSVSSVTVARNEWLAWKMASQTDANVAEHLLFGDYCADAAKFQFRSAGCVVPIRHYRYCTPDNWLVVRGRANSASTEAMREVCQAILESGSFAGRGFSSADDYIYRTAMGDDGPGNPMIWREVNTIHHITQVVSGIGEMQGFSVAQRALRGAPEQLSLLGR
jgi:Beta protein